jgi:hypothetical protein
LVTGILAGSYGVSLKTPDNFENNVWPAASALSEKSKKIPKNHPQKKL